MRFHRGRRAAWGAAAGAVAIAACLALAWSLAAPPAAAPGARAAWHLRAVAAGAAADPLTAQARVRVEAQRGTLATCEAGLERAPAGAPVMAVAGASFTAGVGPGDAGRSWAVLLAREMRWNAVVDGVSGVGYVRTGAGRQGPVARLLATEDLRALGPALVIVQAGHDDGGVSASLERRRVAQAIAAIRAAAPRARIALLTVFTGRYTSASLIRTDAAITAAGRAAGPDVIIMDPLGGRWRFQHADGGLHPTAAGDAWIASKVAAILRAHGVLPAAAGRTPVICDSGAGPRHRSA